MPPSVFAKGGKLSMVHPETFDRVWVPSFDLKKRLAEGYQPLDKAAHDERVQIESLGAEQEKYDRPGTALALGAARGLTFGLSDMVARTMMEPGELAKIKEHNPVASTIGDIGGSVATLAAGPAGGLAKLAGAGAGRVVARGTAKAIGKKVVAKGLGPERAAQMLVTGAAEGGFIGAGQGVSEVALGEEPISIDTLAKAAATRAAKGAAFGLLIPAAGAMVTGAARFGAKGAQKLLKNSGASKTAALRRQRESMTKELDALEYRKSGGGVVVGKDAVRAVKLKGDIAKATEKLAVGQQGVVGRIVEKAVENRAAAIGGGIGGAIGGWPGSALGALVGPKVLDVFKGSMAGTVATGAAGKVLSGAGEAASKFARAARPLVRPTAQAVTTQIAAPSSSEMQTIAQELKATDPATLQMELVAQMGINADQELAGRVAKSASDTVAFLQAKLPAAAMSDQALPGAPPPASTSFERVRFARYMRAAYDPGSVVSDFAARQLTSEAMETMRVLHPEAAEEFALEVNRQVEIQSQRGVVYTPQQRAQIALAGNMQGPRMYDPETAASLRATLYAPAGEPRGGKKGGSKKKRSASAEQLQDPIASMNAQLMKV